ncbi:M48 family metallopeptidase [Dactylosporangium matsuzakiense]|uniref:Zn-dependent protease n=1 Tax=Dactylosporangium matsuzakiense TaxID=53360 RepID=A0A9W6KRJ9_9ACTN|nr:M48 family metallopeptidase [Dactylosporangium matsuzakiense]UWZ47432.1 M48 family metallopeptidase [Dactylosporangium matsuzakiense]GLL05181.1 Zn-dependent protease [Dactylosporangium matsuzakiense]
MKTTVRAVISVGLLAGFYLLAIALIGGLGWVSVWLFQEHPGVAAGKVAYLTIAVAAGLVVAFWKILRAKPGEPEGLPLTPAEAPGLWHAAGDLAQRVATRAPDEIRLIPDVNAAVAEHTRLLGLAGGRRIMYVGLPLLQAFTVAQLTSVLAHELGHYSGSHTRIGALAHRGRMAIVQTIVQVGPSSIAGFVFRTYARLYILVEQAVSRRMEYEADEFSVRIAGRAAAVSSMRDIPVIEAAWNFFVERYVTIGWEAKLAPQDVFGGFGMLLRGRAGELAALRDGAPPEERSRWDSHPPIADRIRAMQAMPDPGVTADERPATVLLADPATLAQRLQRAALNIEDKTLLPWDQLTDVSVAANAQRDVDALFRAAARLAGAAQGDLGLVLALVEQGRAADLARAAQPHGDPQEQRAALTALIAAAIAIATRGGGQGRWRHSWTGGAEFVGPDGRQSPIDEIARLATDPATAPEARRRLAGLGVDAAAVRQQSARATADGAEVVGGIANMNAPGKLHFDVLILTNGLLLIPGPKSTDDGKQRLLHLIRSAPLPELARQWRFLPFEDIAAAAIPKTTPIKVALTLHSGERLELAESWTGERLGRHDNDLLASALEPYVTTPAPTA